MAPEQSFTPIGSDDEEMGPRTTAAANPIGLPLSELKKLKAKFVDAKGKMLKLSLDAFVAALSSSQPPAETPEKKEQLRSELCTLFKKIDAQCQETVDWNEFTEYMLLHMPGLHASSASTAGAELPLSHQVSEAVTAGWGQDSHDDMITGVAIIQDVANSGNASGASSGAGRRYVTCGRDGLVKVWNPNLTVHRTIHVDGCPSLDPPLYMSAEDHEIKVRWDLLKGWKWSTRWRWLTAVCWMSKCRRLAVASSNSYIYFFDSNFAPTWTYIDFSDGTSRTPLCLGYRESTESDGSEVLMVGDSKGCVTVYPLDDDWTHHKEEERKPDESAWTPLTRRQEENVWAPLSFENKRKPIRRQYHDGWVTKVGFVSDMQAMVTSGLDGDINLCDVHMNQRKEKDKGPIRLHKKYGVNVWCWCRSGRFFASGGLDRQIIIWNPYTRMAMNYLQGHTAAILDIQVNESQHQLISMSVDKVVKVWDIQHYRCIQTFTDKTEYKPEDKMMCMAFDEELPGLVVCSSTLNVLPMSVKVETSRTHVAPIIGALYNDVFHQIVSGDSQGNICVWDIRSGRLEFEFRRAHGDQKLICMAFDLSKRRLYTGAEDGEVKLWNFSSGQHLRTYTMRPPSEINGLLWAQTALSSPQGPNTFVVALCWDRRIYVWPGTAKSLSGAAVEPKYILEDNSGMGHSDDISCICAITTVGGLLATGGDDGCVVFWKIQETSPNCVSPVACRLSHNAREAHKMNVSKMHSQEPKALKKRTAGRGGGRVGSMLAFEDASVHSASTMTGPGSPTGGKGAVRGSVMTSSRIGNVSEPESPAQTLMPTHGMAGSDARDRTWDNISGDATWFEDEHSGLNNAAVERMLFLQHKDCLVTIHADRKARLWACKRAKFLQSLDLEAWPVLTSTESCTISEEGLPPIARPSWMQESTTASTVGGDRIPITALYSDTERNQWLFTGDTAGFVRVWDLTCLDPKHAHPVPELPKLHEFQSQQQAITHLQHCDVDGQVVVMSACADWTICICTLEGERIGTFSAKGPHWQLGDKSTWNASPPLLDEGSRPTEADEKLLLSLHRVGKTGNAGRRGRANGGDVGRSVGSGSLGLRTPRGGPLRTRPAVADKVHYGEGVFKNLSVVERWPPIAAITARESSYLDHRRVNHLSMMDR